MLKQRTIIVRYLLLLPVLVFIFAACATESGESSDSSHAPAPVSSITLTPSAAGLAAMSTGTLDP